MTKFLTAALALQLGALAACSSTPDAPPVPAPRLSRVATDHSHLVLMEYEAWFGPNAVTFQGTAAKPLLRSRDMDSVGGGYDSAEPKVIAQHVVWLEHLGVDAAIADLTNNVSCIFDSDWFVAHYLQNFNGCSTFRRAYQTIRDNTGNLYPAWTRLGTRLGLVPLIGAIDQNAFIKDIDGKTAFEKEIEYFGTRMRAYPQRNVMYRGKPLILIYLGPSHLLFAQAQALLHDERYTFRFVSGFLDAQPDLWLPHSAAHGPVQIHPAYGFWSWVDRPDHPTYNRVGDRVENMTVSIATMGQDGWGCPNPMTLPYCTDDALRFGANRSYATFKRFMTDAERLDPIFLIIHQFNEFTPPDEGFDANTDDDIEPADLWGTSALEVVRSEIATYRSTR